MILSRLYANKSSFKKVDFNEGVNIIIGRIDNPENKVSNVHNLGKTLILRLIDYMLLKDTATGDYFDGQVFEEYVFFLEIKLNSGKYATIRRKPNSKLVSIKTHASGKQYLIEEMDWDYENYTVTGKKNAREVLQSLLSFNILSDIKYRDSLTYFLRGQEDYNDPFLLSKFLKSKDKKWKPMLFELLGYNGKLLAETFDINEKITELQEDIDRLEKQFNVKENEIDTLRGIKNVIEGNIDQLTKKTESFDFYLREADISDQLIKNIEKEIALLNEQKYQLKHDIEVINESLNDDRAYDYSEVYELYNEMKILFPQALKKSLDELNEFNRKITNDRRLRLEEINDEKNNELSRIEDKLIDLNKSRIDALSKLKEMETFQKFKEAQKDIISLTSKLESVNKSIEAIYSIKEKINAIAELRKRLDEVKREIQYEIDNGTNRGKQIKKDFSEFIKYIVGADAVLSFAPLKTGNINFRFDFLNSYGEPTKENKGHTYMKEICACMDLSIINSYIQDSYYRFTFHDGCLDGDDPKFAISYLELINRLSQNGMQCIITMVDSVVPKNQDGTTYELNSSDIILELNDAPDGSGTLFGFKF